MKRYLNILTILSILPWKTTSAQATDSAQVINSLNKCWRALSHEYSTIYGLEEEEIKNYSKQKVCFTKDSVSTFYGVFYTPTYSLKKVNAEEYTKENFDCSKGKLNIAKDSVVEITVSSFTRATETAAEHKMTDVVIFDGDCIYVMVDGVIFKMFDADSKIQGRSSN